jgi:biopolymer transport protein ExbD
LRIRDRTADDEFEINVIPLIDVMLTLLMFFVLTTTFVHQTHLKVQLPEASTEPKLAQADELVVLINQEGRYFVGANEVLNPSLAALKDAVARAAGKDREQRITIRADARTPHQAVVTAMDAIGQLGFANLAIATVPAAESGR